MSLVTFCLIPESPKFLVQRKEYAKAIQSYKRIAAINGCKDLDIDGEWVRFHD
jgi:hypothetical protein